MGIPKFYRWLSERYPLILENVGDVRTSRGLRQRVDNLYIDMNSIIHNCSHPFNDAERNKLSMDAIAASCARYLNSVMSLVRPTSLLYIAVDGVAPRAKMNQQRARRFRSGISMEEKERNGITGLFDTNAISPGTEFMQKLDETICLFIQRCQSENPLWKNVRVIYSSHMVPGEGEHKIMDYIRSLKYLPNYDPDLVHCFYGTDGDLLLLGLVTHETNMLILREETISQSAFKADRRDIPMPFQVVYCHVLKQYFYTEFRHIFGEDVELDIERFVDDFVLLMCLVGNDFLPGIPALGIGENGLDLIFTAYKENIAKIGGYICDGFVIDEQRFNQFLKVLATIELSSGAIPPLNGVTVCGLGEDAKDSQTFGASALKGVDDPMFFRKKAEESDEEDLSEFANMSLEDKPKEPDSYDPTIAIRKSPSGEYPNYLETKKGSFRDTYYKAKFDKSLKDAPFYFTLCTYFLDGISWVMRYYHTGCPSWSWYFPFHYAPYIAELANTEWVQPVFDKGEPCTPLKQLMSVLPPYSAPLLPEIVRPLVTDPNSPLAKFYPRSFKTDLNGKKQDYEAVVLLPFIVFSELEKVIDDILATKALSPKELLRNVLQVPKSFTYDKEVYGTLKQTGGAAHPLFKRSIENHSVVKDYIPPQVEFKPTTQMPPVEPNFNHEMPNLFDIPFDFSIAKYGVRLHAITGALPNFGIIPKLPENVASATPSEVAGMYLGRSVFVNYPHMWEGYVGSVFSRNVTYTLEEDDYVEYPTDARWWENECHVHSNALRVRAGIILDKIEYLVEVFPLDHVHQRVDGSRTAVFSEYSFIYPLELVVTGAKYMDRCYRARGPARGSEYFKKGQEVMVVSKDEIHQGVISGFEGEEDIVVSIVPHIDLTPVIVQHFSSIPELDSSAVRQGWFTSEMVAERLNMHPRHVDLLCGVTRIGNFKPINVGLGLYDLFERKEVCGYARVLSNNTVEYSIKAVELLAQYKLQFPKIAINIERIADKQVRERDFGRDSMDGEAYLKGAAAWIASQDHKKAPKVTAGAKIIVEEGLEKLRKTLGKSFESNQDKDRSQLVVKRTDLVSLEDSKYLPLVQDMPVGAGWRNSFISLGSRVVNVSNKGVVPFGLYGTVIGVAETKLYVAFDRVFFAGTDLDGLCGDFLGAMCDREDLLLVQKHEPRASAPSSRGRGRGGFQRGGRGGRF